MIYLTHRTKRIMKKNLYQDLLRRFKKGEPSGVDQDYLRRWSKKPVQDKFTILQSFWEFGEESKRIHIRNRNAEKRKLAKAKK